MTKKIPADPLARSDHHIKGVTNAEWDAFNEVRAKYKLTWRDVFHRFAVYMNGIHYIFQAPDEITKQTQLDLNTVMGLIQLWTHNMRDNCKDISPDVDVSRLKDSWPHLGKPAIVIGAGPTLQQHHHLEHLKAANFKGPVFSTAHSLKWCLEAGIVPDVVSIVDASDKIAGFLDDPLIDKYADDITMVFINSTHRACVDRWKGSKRYWFVSGIPQNLIPNVDTVLTDIFYDLSPLETGGNSGTALMCLAWYLGCNPVGLLGLDFAYPKGFPYDQTQYHFAWRESIGEGKAYKDEADLIAQIYHPYTHPYFKTECYTDFVYDVFRKAFDTITKDYKKHFGVQAINCTGGGAVYNSHIKCMSLDRFLEKYPVRHCCPDGEDCGGGDCTCRTV